ncbi:hypothetical protein [Lonepinella koalarum]|uniref:hypothetical protein n=1 Tax=Lonepinella koalarum TaxID=53417 RepID=UPI0037038241
MVCACLLYPLRFFLAGKQIDDYIYPRFNRWRAFKQYEGIYQALTDDERKVLMDLVSYGSAPAEIPNVKIRSSLLSKGLVQLKMFNPVFQSYIVTPKFYAFLLEKNQKRFLKKNPHLRGGMSLVVTDGGILSLSDH